MDIQKVKDQKIFPNIPKFLEIAQQKRFSILEMDGYQKDDLFEKADIVNELVF
jgi:hypothetical protein